MFDAHKVIPRAGHCILAREYLAAARRIIQPGPCPSFYPRVAITRAELVRSLVCSCSFYPQFEYWPGISMLAKLRHYQVRLAFHAQQK